MDNKAQITGLNVVSQVLMALVVAAFLFGLVGTVASTTSLERDFISRDLSLLTLTLTSAPGNVFFTYFPKKISESSFSYSFNVQKSSVSDFVPQRESWMGVPVGAKTEYFYADNLVFLTSPTDLENPDQLQFLNNNYQLQIQERVSEIDLNAHKFPWVSTRRDSLKDVSFSFVSDDSAKSFADYVILSINKMAGKTVAHFAFDVSKSDVIMNFEVTDSHKDSVFIFINVHNNAWVNRKLASLIANNLFARGVKSVILPIDTPSPHMTLDIELGADVAKSSSQDIKESVFDAIVRYFSK